MPETDPPSAVASADARLKAREKISYGFGDFASCLYWQSISQYLNIFYTDTFGLGAAAAGTMISVSRSCDALVDPAIGMLADRTQTRWGKYRPYLIWFSIPLAIAAILVFTVPNFGPGGKLFWAYVTFNTMMLIYTTINIPYTALMGAITANSAERTALSGIKYVGAYTAGTLVSATLLPMAKAGGWLGAATDSKGFQLAFVIYGAVAVLSFFIVFLNTRERVHPPKAQKTTVWRDLGDLFTNGPWLILLAATISFILFVSLRGGITSHYFKYYVGSQTLTLPNLPFLPKSVVGTQTWTWESLVSVFYTSNQILSIIGCLLIPFVARALGNKGTFVVLFSIAIASTASFFLLKPNQLVLIYFLNAAGSITGGPLSALLFAMYADTADYAEWKRRRRATGLIFSASIFAQKQGWGLGSGLSLILMSQVGFVANTVQTESSLKGLVLLMSLLPAAFGIIALVLVIAYPLSERRMADIAAELKKRRAVDGTEALA
ncbi:MAG TPA: MFS transporter [Opitutaceae bacterium]